MNSILKTRIKTSHANVWCNDLNLNKNPSAFVILKHISITESQKEKWNLFQTLCRCLLIANTLKYEIHLLLTRDL